MSDVPFGLSALKTSPEISWLRHCPGAALIILVWVGFCGAVEGTYYLNAGLRSFGRDILRDHVSNGIAFSYAAFITTQFIEVMIVNATLSAFEYFSGNRKNFREALRYSFFLFVFIVVSYPAIAAVAMFSRHLGINRLIPSQLEQHSVVFFLYPVLWILVYDFFYYWFHRLSHAVPLLWRFHKLHHSIEHLNSFNSIVHCAEDYLRILTLSLPVALILAPPTEHIVLMTAFVALWGQYNHSNANLLIMPDAMRHVVSDNLYHHYHHSIDPSLHNRNFAGFIPFWDRLFGTQYMPTGRTFPVTGVAGASSPATLREYLFYPLKNPG